MNHLAPGDAKAPLSYRPEIDGLRAIALLSVIFFHAGFPFFQGGFVGVDVFFVISGYLITSIILKQKESGNFSLAAFYERRARRILPALLLVVAACVPFAVWFMLPDDLENFGQSVVATMLFSNNMLLWYIDGYFGLMRDLKPLAHTWSLGVEEQYYILYPVLMALLWRFGRRHMRAVLLAALIASMALCAWGYGDDTVATFYFVQTRAWELFLGGLLASNASGSIRNLASPAGRSVLAGIGLAMIFSSIAWFDLNTPFSSLYALVPTVGALLVLGFASSENWAGRFLSLRLLVGLGLVSYSAYLWHQPLFAFARITSLEKPGAVTFMVLTIVAVACAYLSWRYVETPFRNRQAVRLRTFALAISVSTAVLVGVGFLLHATSGYIRSWPELKSGEQPYGMGQNAAYNLGPNRYREVAFDPDSRRKILVFGTSFARDFINAGLANNYFRGVSFSYSQRIPICVGSPGNMDPALAARIAQADYVVFGSPNVSPECWNSDLAILRRMGARKVIVIGTKNFGWNMNAVFRLDPRQRYDYRAKVADEFFEENAIAAKTVGPGMFVDLLSMIADREGRVRVFTDKGKLISQDTQHLTRPGAEYIGRILFQHPLLAPFRDEPPLDGRSKAP